MFGPWCRETLIQVVVLLSMVSCVTATEIIDTCTNSNAPRGDTLNVSFVSADYGVSLVVDTVDSRSNLECILACTRNFRCRSSYFNTVDKTCYMTDTPQTTAGYTTTSSEATGYVTNILLPQIDLELESTYSQCSGAPCAVAGTCRGDCVNNEAVCIGDGFDCDEVPLFNVYQWSSTTVWGTNSGQLFTISYTKKSDTSGLYLQWVGTLRTGNNCGGCAAQYYFTIDNAECSDPDAINWSEYHPNARDHHKIADFFGICNGIGAGSRTIGLHVRHLSGTTNNYAGWNARSRIIIAETEGIPGTATCESLTSFNIQQFTTDYYASTRDENAHWTNTYVKRASDTSLRLRIAVNLYEHGDSYCSRWYFKFNGVECSDPGPLEFVWYVRGDSGRNAHRGYSFNGICHGVPAGTVVVTFHIGICTGYSRNSPHTGWNMITHLLVEETRLGQDISAVLTAQGTIARLPVYNRVQSYWDSLNNGNDVDSNIASVTYTKKSSLSSVNVVWTTNMLQLNNAKCARWYITFNGAECADPGNIESVLYERDITHATNADWHQPGMVEGICHGLAAGTYTVTLAVTNCNGYSGGNAYTGWASGTFAMIEEVFMGI
ncbi:uncharacterized protein LOC106162620 isoform X2 [Lingula anatina]|uniref:Uncharacterized protein LOC106162620 isoform X2 n=1 Tax=Lingula anatina TaxID=7574 RepID=A0A1S3IC24_LINAN|nr:uncharacterized protein LOC106162620 isoform X2 [Lingula anatina]|eukprot:XP_013395411.1 uncharacterized protein LOC106162620 isoform X2 [Lingula anatina]